MLRLTPSAAATLSDARTDAGKPATHGVRFFASAAPVGPGQQPRLAFNFVPAPQPDDAVTEESGLPAYVAPEVAAMVGEATVDTERSGDQVRLILRKETPTSE
jgi:Fe-S cluster assembly iron-binding protein IscA